MGKEGEVSRKMAKFKVDLKKAIHYYLLITKPMHKLTDKRIELLTEILYLYTVEQKNFTRDSDVWKIVFDKENRANIRDALNMPKQVFENYMTEFRKRGIIINNQVNPAYNPAISSDCKAYEIVFRFDINGEYI